MHHGCNEHVPAIPAIFVLSMFCSNCGHKRQDTSRFCSNCGSNIATDCDKGMSLIFQCFCIDVSSEQQRDVVLVNILDHPASEFAFSGLSGVFYVAFTF